MLDNLLLPPAKHVFESWWASPILLGKYRDDVGEIRQVEDRHMIVVWSDIGRPALPKWLKALMGQSFATDDAARNAVITAYEGRESGDEFVPPPVLHRSDNPGSLWFRWGGAAAEVDEIYRVVGRATATTGKPLKEEMTHDIVHFPDVGASLRHRAGGDNAALLPGDFLLIEMTGACRALTPAEFGEEA